MEIPDLEEFKHLPEAEQIAAIQGYARQMVQNAIAEGDVEELQQDLKELGDFLDKYAELMAKQIN